MTQSFSVTQQVSGDNGGTLVTLAMVVAPSSPLQRPSIAPLWHPAVTQPMMGVALMSASIAFLAMVKTLRAVWAQYPGRRRRRVEAVNGEGAMPSYAGFLCPNDVIDLQAYLNSVSKTTKFLDWDVQLEKIVSGTPAPVPTGVIPGP